MRKRDDDTYSYKGWLLSDKWYRRAIAVYGYAFIGGFIAVFIIYVIAIILGIAIGLLAY